jgi:hypothetical protein
MAQPNGQTSSQVVQRQVIQDSVVQYELRQLPANSVTKALPLLANPAPALVPKLLLENPPLDRDNFRFNGSTMLQVNNTKSECSFAVPDNIQPTSESNQKTVFKNSISNIIHSMQQEKPSAVVSSSNPSALRVEQNYLLTNGATALPQHLGKGMDGKRPLRVRIVLSKYMQTPPATIANSWSTTPSSKVPPPPNSTTSDTSL